MILKLQCLSSEKNGDLSRLFVILDKIVACLITPALLLLSSSYDIVALWQRSLKKKNPKL